MRASKKGINRLITRTVVEMVIVAIFAVVSFFIFSNNTLQDTAQTAQAYSEANYDFQTAYTRTDANNTDLMTDASLIDEITVSVRNPNKFKKTADVFILIQNKSSINLENLELKLDDKTIDLNKGVQTGDIYKVYLDSKEVNAYSTYKGNVQFIGDSYRVGTIKYSFDIS